MHIRQLRRLGLNDDDVRSRVRRGEYRRLHRGVYLIDADLFDTLPWESRAHAALLLHGPRAVLGLGTAARLIGIAGADTDPKTIDVVLPRRHERYQHDGVQLHWWNLPPEHVMEVDGFRLTTAVRTLADLVPRLRRNPAVCVLDSALHQGFVGIDDLDLVASLAAGRPGADIAAHWWGLADGRAESPLETWVRLDCGDGGVPPDCLQWEVRNAGGRFLGRSDLAWLRTPSGRPLVGEADGGGPHSQPLALFKDRRRQNDFVAADVDVVRFTWSDARRRGQCAGLVRRVLAR